MNPKIISLTALFGGLVATEAQTNFYQFAVSGGNATFNFQSNAAVYYVVKATPDLRTNFAPVRIVLGASAPPWATPATNPAGFFLPSAISLATPTDTLGDGIDDLFKLNRGLNPVDPFLAGSNSGYTDGAGNPLTWLQYYLRQFPGFILENYGREVSVFNHGLPTASYEAFSRELSLYNGESAPFVTMPLENYSREVSVFNAIALVPNYEAIGREVSLYNGESPAFTPDLQEVYSREVSVFGESQSFGSADAISQEFSVFNFGEPVAAVEAIGREVSVFNNALN